MPSDHRGRQIGNPQTSHGGHASRPANRKVSAHHMMGGEHYPHALSKVTTKPDGSSERTMIGVARDGDNSTVERWKSYGNAWAGPNTKWEYSHEESPK